MEHFSEGEIWVLEPRRVAAKYAAIRVSEEIGEKVGSRVGFHFRFESAYSKSTRVLFLTEGMFLKRLQSNPNLLGVAVVVLDEFHERSMNGDIALAVLVRLLKTSRTDIKCVVMSATLETQVLFDYAKKNALDWGVVDVEAVRFPLEVHYRSSPLSSERDALEKSVALACSQLMEERESGDVLVFLPGMAEIRRCEQRLKEWAEHNDVWVLPLHGELSSEEQKRAILPQKKRKIVLSTNIAETSLTLDGLFAVVDSGWARKVEFSPWSGFPVMKTVPVSQASAIQRAGRAARQGQYSDSAWEPLICSAFQTTS
jgi:ATP-dependent helicase HrpB